MRALPLHWYCPALLLALGACSSNEGTLETETRGNAPTPSATPDGSVDGGAAKYDSLPTDETPTDDIDAGSDAATPATTPKDGFFVLVGYGGLRARSTDGLTWTNTTYEVMSGGDDQNLLRDVAGGDGKIVTAGWKIKHSADARTWTDDATMGQWFGGLTFGNGLWVSAGGCARRGWSVDGVKWSFVDAPCTFSYRSLAFGTVMGGRWAAVGDKGMTAWTSDGKTWTAGTGGGSSGLSDVAFGQGRFVAVGNGTVVTSTDGGASWVQQQSVSGANNITYGAHGFVAIGGGKVSVSTDGVTWSQTNGFGGSVAYGNGVYVTVDFGGHVFRSVDGKSWSDAGTLQTGKNGVHRVRFVTP